MKQMKIICIAPAFLRDTPGGRTPCLHGRASDGQRSSSGLPRDGRGIAVSDREEASPIRLRYARQAAAVPARADICRATTEKESDIFQI